MVQLAIQGQPGFVLDSREAHRTDKCFTVDTLAALRAELGAMQPLCLLLGSDAFLQLHTWHEWRQLFELANIAIAARPGAHLQQPDTMPDELRHEVSQRQVAAGAAAGPAGAVWLRQMTPLDISATAIRDTLVRQGSARYLLPDAVLDYIHEHQLYARHEH